MDIINNTYKYEYEYLKLYKNNDPIIFHYRKINNNISININSFMNEYLIYDNILKTLKNYHLMIPVVLSSNNKHVPFIYTTLVSILENANRKTFYLLYLLVPSDFSGKNKNVILKLNNKYKCNIIFIYPEKYLKKLKMNSSNLTSSSYYRLIVADLLPNKLSKCIYLDLDICVCNDLTELFNIDIKDNYIAGVVDPEYYFSEEDNYKSINTSLKKELINDGMILMNLKLIRKNNLTKKFIELFNKNLDFHAQDILNIACNGKIKILAPKYNSKIKVLKENNYNLSKIYKEGDIIEAINQPYIIHFMDKNKSWNDLRIYINKYWWNIAKKTPYINNSFNRYNIYKYKLKLWWFNLKKKELNIDNPQTFNEKIQWLKLYDTIPIKTKLTDRYLVRDYIKNKIGEEYLIPLLGVYKKFDDINFDVLPNQFVIGCNHGSYYNIIVKNKINLNVTKTKLKINSWMKINYAFLNGLELQYKDIEPMIIIEKYMDNEIYNLMEYKFHCFNGKPKYVCLDSYKNENHRRNLYNLNWKQLPYKINNNYKVFPSPKKPKLFDKMVSLVSKLSEGFIYTRIDFYIANGKIYFGKILFTPSSGTDEILPKKFERKLSSFIKLPRRAYNIDTGESIIINKSFSIYPYYTISVILFSKILYKNFKYIF